ncbi:7-carboxy-7-deazaguanine synthase QueE [Odoribacter lunatus]|uniref:7-carboxy-7-deazaguanine synthase QueE n=1 Tax=Odoribacter lunatus TaxID=2941335 RepID=UPI002041234D|nr:7-carboxy-7-deazaguanine synthase QueE [Odoribacter lunatus]
MDEKALILAEDGIFPIVRDADGNLLPQLPASGLDFSGTIQGEGKLNGIPSLFVRLAGCNLHCTWQSPDGNLSGCDTAYASYAVRHSVSMSVERVCQTILHNTEHLQHLVITGGEPLLQAKSLNLLFIRIKQERHFHITIETNATLFDEKLARHIDFFSLSPKLSTSVPATPYADLHEKRRMQPEVIQQFIDHSLLYKKDFQLKFVCSGDQDVAEIKELLSRLQGWKNEDVLLMPLGCNSTELQKHTQQVLKYCIQNGWRYCDRLHISLFGNKSGV